MNGKSYLAGLITIYVLLFFNFFYTYSISESQIEHIINEEKIVTEKTINIPFDTLNKAYNGKIVNVLAIKVNSNGYGYYSFSFKTDENKSFSCKTERKINEISGNMKASVTINKNGKCVLIGVNRGSKS